MLDLRYRKGGKMPKPNEARLRKGGQYEYESLDGKYVITRQEMSDGMYWLIGEACEGGYGVKEWFDQYKHLWQIRQLVFEMENYKN
jgi:hypothetical protein